MTDRLPCLPEPVSGRHRDIEAARDGRRDLLPAAILSDVLTTYDDDTSILAALQAGARSYLTKDASRARIAQTLRAAADGLAVLDPVVQARLLAAASATRRPPGRQLPPQLPDGLTQREAEILSLIAEGKTNPDIAAELYVSTYTVKSHINRIFAKTGSADRAAAIRYARLHDLG